MRLAICLLTADRAEYTRATLESLARTNPGLLAESIRLHADDGSADARNELTAHDHGFATVYRAALRSGQAKALASMWAGAVNLGATHILHLENDIEWVRQLVLPGAALYVDSVRLYGVRKGRDGDPRGVAGVHVWGTKDPIAWLATANRQWERADAHWGGMPSITRAQLLVDAVASARRLKDISAALPRLDTIRPTENIVFHMGATPTPDRFRPK